ncbi:MAG: hypothetical protein IPO80_06330 [Propionibacteriaceae bacterium]|nr:hypothetical protein [Propionibacteriaceae bacterium]
MSHPESRTPPPVTGIADVDAALDSLVLSEDVNDHHKKYAAALDALQSALNTPPADLRR